MDGEAPAPLVPTWEPFTWKNGFVQIVFAEVPEQGKSLNKGDEAAVVESVKAASDVYAPVAGEVIIGNPALADSQIFICLAPMPSLDGKHVIFGEVMHAEVDRQVVLGIEVDGEYPPTGFGGCRRRSAAG